MDRTELIQKTLPVAGLALLIGGVIGTALVVGPILESSETVASVSAADVFSLTNEERSDEGIATLQRNSLLDQAAQMKAQDMAAKGYYAHVSPEGLTPMHWVEVAGYKYLIIGENLVVNRKDAEQVVDAFMGSPGHRANILRKDFTEIGVGVANGVFKGKDATFAVQIFAAPYPRAAATEVKTPKPVVKPVATPVKSTPTPVPSKSVEPKPVPRTSVAATTTPVRVTTTQPAANPDSIQEKVKVLIQPILSGVQATSVPTTSTTTFNAPSFALNTTVPIELVGVSQLEADTLPVPLGSTWTMELRSFVEGVLLSARGFFAR